MNLTVTKRELDSFPLELWEETLPPAPGSDQPLWLSSEGRLKKVTDEFCRMASYGATEPIGKRITDLTLPGSMVIFEHVEVVFQFGSFRSLWMVVGRNGQRILLRADWKLLRGRRIELCCEKLLDPGREIEVFRRHETQDKRN